MDAALSPDTALESAAAKKAAGAHVDALREIGALLIDHPGDPRLYREGFEALSAAAAAGELTRWNEPEKEALYRRLVLQEGCDARPRIFHHGLAGLVTARSPGIVRAIAADAAPVLRRMLEEAGEGTPGERAVLLWLLVVRGLAPEGLLPADLGARHAAAFPSFEPQDLALPYSVKFNAEHFGQNRDEIVAAWAGPRALDPAAGLRLTHLLLLEWLAQRRLFVSPDNGDLLDALRDRLGPAATAEDRAAGRSLILRHWRPGGRLTAEALAGTGIGAEVVEAAAGLARPARPDADSRARKRVEDRKRQAFHAARHRVAAQLPFVTRGERRVRVALCVSGQMRGWRAALDSWRRTFLNQVDCDIYIHTWARIGQPPAQHFRSVLPFAGEAFTEAWRRIGTLESYDGMQARYPSLFAALANSGTVEADDLRRAYGATDVVVEDEESPRFAGFSNQDKMHYKIHAAHRLASESGRDYDLMLRIRPDLPVRLIGFDWRDMVRASRAEPVLFAEGGMGVHYGGLLMGDQMAIAAPDVMSVYAGTWERHRNLGQLGLWHFPEKLAGHVSLAQTCWLHGFRIGRVPIRCGGLLAAAPVPMSVVHAALRADSEGRADGMDRDLLAAAAADIGAPATP